MPAVVLHRSSSTILHCCASWVSSALLSHVLGGSVGRITFTSTATSVGGAFCMLTTGEILHVLRWSSTPRPHALDSIDSMIRITFIIHRPSIQWGSFSYV